MFQQVWLDSYQNDTDGHARSGRRLDNPGVLFGVHNLPHQHHRLVGQSEEKQQEDTRFRTVTANDTEHLLALTLTSTPKIGWQGKMKLR